MTNAVIVSTARTPLAKSWRGAFNMTHGATLGGHAVKHAIARAGIDAAHVEDVIMGCANPEGADLINKIAEKTNIPKVDVLVTLETMFKEIKFSLSKGENIYIRGFGSFITKKRAAKIGRNIKRNTAVQIPAHFIPAFKPAKEFMQEVKKLEIDTIIKDEGSDDMA
jgi:DNA-binding protein HU-beta